MQCYYYCYYYYHCFCVLSPMENMCLMLWMNLLCLSVCQMARDGCINLSTRQLVLFQSWWKFFVSHSFLSLHCRSWSSSGPCRWSWIHYCSSLASLSCCFITIEWYSNFLESFQHFLHFLHFLFSCPDSCLSWSIWKIYDLSWIFTWPSSLHWRLEWTRCGTSLCLSWTLFLFLFLFLSLFHYLYLHFIAFTAVVERNANIECRVYFYLYLCLSFHAVGKLNDLCLFEQVFIGFHFREEEAEW